MKFVPGHIPVNMHIGAHREPQRRSAKPIPKADMPVGDIQDLSRQLNALQRQMCALQEELEGRVSDLGDRIAIQFVHLYSQLKV